MSCDYLHFDGQINYQNEKINSREMNERRFKYGLECKYLKYKRTHLYA